MTSATDPHLHRRIGRLAWPIIVSNISVPLLGAVDTAVVGRLPGAQYLGAVAVGSLVFSVLFAGINFLRMGTTGLTAQALGAGKPDQAAAWLGRGLLVALALAAVILAVQVPLVWGALRLVDAAPEVSTLAGHYLHIRLWAMPAALINMVCLGWFLGIHASRTALWVQIFLNVVNMVLDILFVLGLHWGVAGAAGATVAAECVTALLSLGLVHLHLRRQGARLHLSRLWDGAALARMVRVNGDIFIRSCCLQGAFFAFTAAGARMSPMVLAVNAVLLNLQNMASYGLDGLANVAEMLAGEAKGAGDRDRLRAVVGATAIQAGLLGLLIGLVWAAAGTQFVALLTDLDNVRSACSHFLPWLVVLPPISVWCYLLDGVFIGTTHTRAMRNSMALSLAVFLAGVALLTPRWGNHGLWAAFTLFNAVRGLTMWRAWPDLLQDTHPEPAAA